MITATLLTLPRFINIVVHHHRNAVKDGIESLRLSQKDVQLRMEKEKQGGNRLPRFTWKNGR